MSNRTKSEIEKQLSKMQKSLLN